MNRRALLATAALALSLAGCNNGPTPVATVSASEASLAAAGKVALAYVTLPVCVSGGATVCADPKIKAQIKLAYDQAYAAVTSAQTTADAGGTPTMTAVTATLTALQNIVATLPK